MFPIKDQHIITKWAQTHLFFRRQILEIFSSKICGASLVHTDSYTYLHQIHIFIIQLYKIMFTPFSWGHTGAKSYFIYFLILLSASILSASPSSLSREDAAVLVQGGQSELVQRREQPDDLLRYDVLPERFRAVR